MVGFFFSVYKQALGHFSICHFTLERAFHLLSLEWSDVGIWSSFCGGIRWICIEAGSLGEVTLQFHQIRNLCSYYCQWSLLHLTVATENLIQNFLTLFNDFLTTLVITKYLTIHHLKIYQKHFKRWLCELVSPLVLPQYWVEVWWLWFCYSGFELMKKNFAPVFY